LPSATHFLGIAHGEPSLWGGAYALPDTYKPRGALRCAVFWQGKGSLVFAPMLLSCAIKSYLVDPASSHMLVSKIKPCMSKYKLFYTVKLRMAH